MAFPKTKEKSKMMVCQDCLELVDPTKIYSVFKIDHYYFSCEPCMKDRGVTGEVWRKPRTKKSKS
jgi:hypothetical protein